VSGSTNPNPKSRFGPDRRVKKPREFEAVYTARFKAADGVLLLFLRQNEQGRTRIGLSVSRKHGGAVVRNRLKRWLREAFRLEQHQLPAGIDLVAIPLDASRGSLAAYRSSLVSLTRRLIRRFDRAAAENA